MTLSGCCAALKYIVVAVNLIFWLAGLAVISLSIWLLADATPYVRAMQDETSYSMGLYVLLGAGTLMFIVGFLGCSGAYRESQCMLVSFFCFLLIILVAEIAAGAWAYSHSERLEEMIKENVMSTVKKEYGVIASRTQTFTAIQSGLKCCGASGPSDWSDSVYNKEVSDSSIEMTLRSILRAYNIPPSCCTTDQDGEVCEVSRHANFAAPVSSLIYSEGCVDKLINILKDNSPIFLSGGIIVALVEILGLIFSIILCCAIRSKDRYKA